VCEVDRDPAALRFNRAAGVRGSLCQAVAERLPFPDAAFDIALCHFLLLWVLEPLSVLREMRRVTVSGGAVLALAEPDYGGRIDWPPGLVRAGRHQADALARAGAHLTLGRQLRELFHQAGMVRVHISLLGGEWRDGESGSTSREHAVLEHDLAGSLPAAELRDLLEIEEQSARDQTRLLFVPTFSAIGFVP
jgi:SAM-dependent methyltransferase